ncbi:hypothetical protein Salat_1688300 [Sesamum alatum]|uniref:Uncharacterized protein n=1 Tax=Sesamum alatum TaxID=300844 RepID=A0AAE1Y7S3_9LAMI|nr:hypothetical protein Salat_1688300 [Sesamum alatum]
MQNKEFTLYIEHNHPEPEETIVETAGPGSKNKGKGKARRKGKLETKVVQDVTYSFWEREVSLLFHVLCSTSLDVIKVQELEYNICNLMCNLASHAAEALTWPIPQPEPSPASQSPPADPTTVVH